MLTVSQIESNITKFEEKNIEYNIFTKELSEFLGRDYYIAPASTHLDMFGCYPGGLLQHSFKACKYAVQINDLLPEHLKQDKISLIKCVFLSQIGKTFLFIENKNEWQIKNMGKLYDFNNSIVSMKNGERSVYYALQYGVKLNETEYQAIINSDKDPEDKQAKFFSQPLTQIMRQGFELAIMEDKNVKKQSEHTTKILI